MKLRSSKTSRRRIVGTLLVLALLSLVQVFTSLAARPGVSEVSTGGFGNKENAYSWSMTWFKGKLYVGTAANPLCVENALLDYYYPGYGLYPEHPAPDLTCAADKYDLDLRAEIWQFTPGTHAWKLVYKSETVDNPRAPGKQIARDIGYRGMAVINDTLVVGDVTAGEYIPELLTTAPPRFLKSTDGETFTAVPGAPGQIHTSYGAYDVIGYRGIIVMQGRLFATASQSYTGDGAVLEIQDPLGSSPTYTQVSPSDLSVFELETFNNALYIGTGSATSGYGVWKASLSTPGSAFSFTPIVTNGAGRGQAITSVVSMHVFRDRLYVGASGWYSTVFPGSELIRIASDDSWQLVVGNSRTLSSGKTVYPISGLPDGYGNVFNAHFWRMEDMGGALYVGTNDWSWSFRDVPIFNTLLSWQFGFDIYSSCDGQYWNLVTMNAFGDGTYNFGARTMQNTPAGGFVGSANHGQGTAIWQGSSFGFCRTPFPWRQTRGGRANDQATTTDGTLQSPSRVLTEVVDGKNVVSWDAVDGAANYRVLRAGYTSTPGFAFDRTVTRDRGFVPDFPPPAVATGDSTNSVLVPGQFTEIGTTSDTHFTDTTAAAGNQYAYQIVAESASGTASDPSNTTSSQTASQAVTFAIVRSSISDAAARGDVAPDGSQTLLATLKRAEWAASKNYCNVAAKSLDDLQQQVYATSGSGVNITSETTREDLGDIIMRLGRQVSYGASTCH